jgi:metal-sulfur cluster biosynthetic enzyme
VAAIGDLLVVGVPIADHGPPALIRRAAVLTFAGGWWRVDRAPPAPPLHRERRMAESPDAIVAALRSVYDPCCQDKGISVVDMGLVRSVAVDGDRARVELLLTTGWCPFAANLVGMISERVTSLPEVAGASVEIVWDEPWTTERLSDGARRKLRFLPHPNALHDHARPEGDGHDR